jgi:hypothetical protein
MIWLGLDVIHIYIHFTVPKPLHGLLDIYLRRILLKQFEQLTVDNFHSSSGVASAEEAFWTSEKLSGYYTDPVLRQRYFDQ